MHYIGERMSSHCTYGVLFDVGQLDLISCLCTDDAKSSCLGYATLKGDETNYIIYIGVTMEKICLLHIITC